MIQLILLTLALVAVLMVGGLPLAQLLPSRLHSYSMLLAPLLGFGVLSSISHYLGAAGITVHSFAWPTVILMALATAAILMARRRRAQAASRIVVLMAGIYFLALIPVLSLGTLTPIGRNSDIVSYLCRAELLAEPTPVATSPIADRPCDAWAIQALDAGLRRGAIYLMAWVDVLMGARAYQIYPLAIALGFALAAGSLYVLCRHTFKLSRHAALGVAALAGTHNLLLWPVYDGFLSQVLGVSLLPATLCLMIEALRRPSWRATGMAGFLLATLCSAYPPHALMAIAISLAMAGASFVDQHRRRPGSLGTVVNGLSSASTTLAAMAAVTIASNAVAWSKVGRELAMVQSFAQRKSGNIQVFPHPGEIFGLVNHPTAAYDLWFPQLPALAAHLMFGVAIAFCVAGWFRLRRVVRPLVGAWLLIVLGHTLIQRFGIPGGSGFPYGYFKSLSPTILALLPLFTLGLLHRGGDRRGTARHLASGLAILLIVLHGANTGLTLFYVPKYRVVADQDLLEVATGVSELPIETPMLVDLPPGLEQNWAAYLLRDRPIRFRRPLQFFRAIDGPRPDAHFEQHVLIQRDRTGRMQHWNDLWYDTVRYDTIWQSSRYAIQRSKSERPAR
ncbi:MAG: hypothetical protein AAF560_11895 [Acidobacteriota bacterium]